MRRRRQEADIGRMAAVDIGMRDARQNREVFPILLEDLEVVRGRVVASRIGREKLGGQQTKVVADTEHATRHGSGLGMRHVRRSHGVEERQRKAYANPAKHRAARTDVSFHVTHLYWKSSLCTIPWTMSRTPYPDRFVLSRISSTRRRSLKPIGAPVALGRTSCP